MREARDFINARSAQTLIEEDTPRRVQDSFIDGTGECPRRPSSADDRPPLSPLAYCNANHWWDFT